ncbi:MAG TPA: hypothetical protein VGH54_26420 [Mycobacterium sp.]|jgi:hypothetical protein|uniref:hypothetical protein n=1 Tax=Mycobacterium sp. TaxID=1785 RepID=UPI002F3FDCC0
MWALGEEIGHVEDGLCGADRAVRRTGVRDRRRDPSAVVATIALARGEAATIAAGAGQDVALRDEAVSSC